MTPRRCDPALVRRIETVLARPAFFREVLDAVEDCLYRDVLVAWSEVRMRYDLSRDEMGRYVMPRVASHAP